MWPTQLVGQFRVVKTFTAVQGSYLSFIYIYTRLHGRPPAEAEMQQFFRVTPPSVHQMIVTLDRNGLISRIPGASRSIEVLVAPNDLPLLRFLGADEQCRKVRP